MKSGRKPPVFRFPFPASRLLPLTFHLSLFTFFLLLGCAHLEHHQRASNYLEQARGPNGIETLLNLTMMMEATVEATRMAGSSETGVQRLHDQFHAFHEAMDDVAAPRTSHPGYQTAVTLSEELRTLFHRLWHLRHDDRLRDVHLDLFASRLLELRGALESVRSSA